MSKLRNIHVVTIAAMLTAAGVILGFFKIPITNLIEIRFQSIPVALSGMLLGPYVGGVVGILTDVLSYLVKPTGAFFPGFTISSMATGVIFGLFLYRRPFSIRRVALAEVVVTAAVNILLNSLWLAILYHTPYLVSLTTRLPKELIMLPINVVLIAAVAKGVPAAALRFLPQET